MIVATCLIAAGCAAIVARVNYKDAYRDSRSGLWQLSYDVSFHAKRAGDQLQIWLPRDNKHLRVYRQSMNHPDLILENSGATIQQSRLDLVADEPGNHAVRATFDFELGPEALNPRSYVEPSVSAEELNRWLRSTKSIRADSPVAIGLVNDWKQQNTSEHELVRQIFRFCRYELETGDEAWQDDAESTLTDRMGTDLGRLKAMVALCRAARIGARLTSGFEIIEDGEIEPVFWVEVLQAGNWTPYDPVHGFSIELPWNWVKVAADTEFVVNTVGGEDLEAEFTLMRLSTAGSLSAANRHWSSVFDLTRLPHEVHEVLSLMLLLPLGALITAFFHTVIGWRTIGIFTPALIALSFILADWRTGVVVFALAISLGMLTRSMVEPLRLLMVARLGFMLTLVVVFLVMTVSCLDYFRLTPSANAVLLPIVILTLSIEKLYMSTIEEGTKKAASLMLATAIVSFCCYLLLGWRSVGLLVLQLPELHFFTLASLILLGRYTGYRLSELYRFRDLAIAQTGTASP